MRVPPPVYSKNKRKRTNQNLFSNKIDVFEPSKRFNFLNPEFQKQIATTIYQLTLSLQIETKKSWIYKK